MNYITGLFMIISMLILMILIKKESKLKKPSVYLLGYVLVWLVFGGVYWLLATINNNSNVILQEYIRIKSLSRTIYDKLDHKYRLDNIESIVKTHSYELN